MASFIGKRRIISGVLLGLAFACAIAGCSGQDGDRRQAFEFAGSSLKLAVPSSFLAIPRSGPVVRTDSLLLLATLPALQGKTAANEVVFRSNDGTRIVRILIRTNDGGYDLGTVASIYDRPDERYRVEKLGHVFGLQAVRQVPPPTGKFYWQTLYRDAWDRQPTIAIQCDGEGTVPVPDCTHHFTYKGALVQLGYGLTHVQDWQTMQKSVVAKLDEWSETTERH